MSWQTVWRAVCPAVSGRPTHPGSLDAATRSLGTLVAALDLSAGDKTVIDDQFEDAMAVLDAFHAVRLGTTTVSEARRRVQQDTLWNRGWKGDPLFGIQAILRAEVEYLIEMQRARPVAAIETDEAHDEVFVSWQCAQRLRSASHQKDLAEGRRIAPRRSPTHSTPARSPETTHLGRSFRRWGDAFLAYFTTSRARRRH